MPTNVVLVTWPEASKAYQAMTELRNQDAVRVKNAAIVVRQPDGSFSIPDSANRNVGLGTLGGSVIGSLLGVLGGPLGILLGFTSGALFGSLVDVGRQVDDGTVLAAMSRSVPAGGTALVAEVDEDSPDAVDALVKQSGGTLIRRPLDDVRAEVAAAEEAAIAAAAEASRVLSEQKKAEHKAELEAKWDEVKAKFKSVFS